ncbi:MAG: DNA cytosine methyltransferase, partial [Peptostreptococcaceae bacterium]
RVIFICNRINKINYHPQPLLKSSEYKTTRDAIEDLMDLEDNKEFNHVKTKHQGNMPERLAAVPEGASLYENYSDSWKKCPWDKPSCTVKENHGAVNIHPKRPRVITAREMARLQSFPDNFIFQGAKKWQLVQLGNAVPPLLGKAIALSVEKSIEENEEGR